MNREVITVKPDDSLSRVKEIFFSRRIHHLPVVEGRKLVGMISYNDLVKVGRNFDEYDRIQVREVMTTKIAALEPEDKIGAAAQVFLENLFHGLPIVNGQKEVVGIVTTHDILRYEFKKEYPNEDV